MTSPIPPLRCAVPGCETESDGLHPGQSPRCPICRARANASVDALIAELCEAADAANAAAGRDAA